MEQSSENRCTQLSPTKSPDCAIKKMRWPSLSSGCRHGMNSRSSCTSINNMTAAQELFYEACSALYNDILDAVDHHLEVNESEIICRQMELIKQGAELSNAVPQLSNLIASKLSTVSRAMEHLKLNRQSSFEAAGNSAKEERESTALAELRKWVQTTGEKLSEMEAKFSRIPLARKVLDRLAADQQILQLQIETEGQTLVKNVQRTVASHAEDATECWVQRRKRHLKALTQRWYHLWLRSLSVQCRIEQELNQLYLSDEESENDPELREPQVKRRRFNNNRSHLTEETLEETETESEARLRSEEDTIPFAAEEYESIDSDTMPQTEEEVPCKNGEHMKMDESTSSSSTAAGTKSDAEHQPDIGYSSGENSNSVHETATDVTNCLTTMLSTETTEETDQQRRLRIQSSPVKSFYKTVPLDETGATDTETPRVSLSGWPTSSLYTTDVMHVLSDSLIVNAEEEPELDSNDDMKEILSMLDDDENGNPMGMLCKGLEQQQQQGTRWHEFKSGKNRYQLPFSHNSLFVSVNDNDKNSCDASSEESDDLPTDIQSVTISAAATTPPLPVDWKHCSLKRRRKSRISSSDRLPLLFGPIIKSPTSSALGHDMEASVCSNCSQTCSEITYLNSASGSFHSVRLPRPHDSRMAFRTRHNVRRKLRVRRLPRSMSDGEHLGLRMNTSTYSAPGASAIRDSDATAPEQSDAPPYEWDDYNPPAKAEDDWEQCDGEPDDMSVLTIEDDFQMQLGDLHSLNGHFCSSIPRTYGRNRADELRTPAKDRPPRPIAAVTGNCVPKHPNCANGNWNLDLAKIMMTAATTAATKTMNTSTNLRYRHHHHHSESDLVTTLALPQSQPIISNTNSSTECSQSLPSAPSSALAAPVATEEVHSPLPAILSKIEKFASSLKLIQDDEHNSTTSSSLSTLSSIRSLGDVVSTLKIFTDIHERLLEEQEELQSFLSSDSFSGDLSGLVDEFEPLSKGYEDAIKRVEYLMAQIEAIRENWNDWAETQRNMQAIMRGIENELAQLRKGGDNSEQICSELELCQERMNRLETVCNYLTSNLASLHHDNSANAPSIDFASELALYSNALVQLRTRFENEIRPATTAADKATWVGTRKRRHFKEQLMPKKFSEHSTAMDDDIDHVVVASNIVGPAKLGWSLKAFLFIVVLAAFTAWFSNSTEISWRTTLGPHLDYVNGPPPV